MFGKSFEEKVKEAVQDLRGLGITNLNASVEGKTVTLTGDAPDMATKTRVMQEFNARVETDNTVNAIRVEKHAPAPVSTPAARATTPMSMPAPVGTTTAPAAAAARTHEVAKGETLSAIAQRYYGKASEYPKIFEANKDVLKDPDKIFPGQKLRIP
jgi:nucleoid-associated protein YgaU